jgi:hypothetical protein
MTILDMILATFALVLFAAYLLILVWFVPHLDLIIVCVVVTLLAAFDFARSAFGRRLRERRARR